MNSFELMEYWAKGIAADTELSAWVGRTFDRPLTIYLGFDDVGRFGEENTPYLAMAPIGEELGPDRDILSLSVMLMFGLKLDDAPTEAGGIIAEPSMEVMEKEFSPRVLEAIARLSPDLAPGTGEGRTYPPRNGYCERDFIVTLSVPNTINLKREPWR